MLTSQFVLPIASELVVDLFAGGGGASTGIEQAIGRHVDIAVNHDPEAVSLHEVNHPQTRHYTCDVFEIDPLEVTGGQPIGLLWASPDCKHFSKAKGGNPVSKKIRGLANVIAEWAEKVRPRVICMENVEEFKTWGPLDEENYPIPERPGQAPRVPGLEKPLGTAVDGQKHALVTAFLAQHNKERSGVKAGRPAQEPISTITASGGQQTLVTAALVGVGGRAGQSRPRGMEDPAATITSKYDTAVVTSNLVKLRGTSTAHATDEPLHTVSAQGQHFAEVRAFLIKYYGSAEGAAIDDPVHTIPTHDRFGLVTVHGEDYAIVDIGLRMLTPRELYRAQGFPDNYVIERGARGEPMTKTAQVRMCGNSVCPPLARAIVAANYRELGQERAAA
ncbi:DNA cytosine methyltransferase [Variovorax sp.]|uniref:DNA cytosine methyltransferase n=1 Tax=Variovorax sp. TaxID=1871043 RepID=UPI003BA8E178